MSAEDQAVSTLGTLRLLQSEEQTLVCLPCRGPYWRLSNTLATLRALLKELGLSAAGPLTAAFLDDPEVTPAGSCRYVLAYPVELAAAAASGVADLTPLAGSEPDSFWQALFGGRLRAAPEDGRAGPALLRSPAGPCAEIEYRGPARGSPSAYLALDRALEQRGLKPQGPPEEVYAAEPGTLDGGLMHALIRRRLAPPV
jgi:hypothetical protein